MNTQETPVHIKLWHRDFWLLITANLLLTMSVYMPLTTMPLWLMQQLEFSAAETGVVMGVFGVGLYLLGSQCSWLVQRFRRNEVCMLAIIALTLTTAWIWYTDCHHQTDAGTGTILLQRLLAGIAFGLAQMVLSSTLIIDTCESFQRTHANHISAWAARFALALGPLAGTLVYKYYGFQWVIMGSMGCSLASLVLIYLVSFPFRSPEDNMHVISLDRFFLTHGLPIFINLLPVGIVAGMLLTIPADIRFYALMTGGFIVSVIAQHYVFRKAEPKSEVISGLILLMAALLILIAYPTSHVAPILIGLGIGLVAARFLLLFIDISRHCQRGTSQSTYFLAWESGIALGIALGYGTFYQHPTSLLVCALVLIIGSLALYHFHTHSWCLTHKNR